MPPENSTPITEKPKSFNPQKILRTILLTLLLFALFASGLFLGKTYLSDQKVASSENVLKDIYPTPQPSITATPTDTPQPTLELSPTANPTKAPENAGISTNYTCPAGFYPFYHEFFNVCVPTAFGLRDANYTYDDGSKETLVEVSFASKDYTFGVNNTFLGAGTGNQCMDSTQRVSTHTIKRTTQKVMNEDGTCGKLHYVETYIEKSETFVAMYYGVDEKNTKQINLDEVKKIEDSIIVKKNN